MTNKWISSFTCIKRDDINFTILCSNSSINNEIIFYILQIIRIMTYCNALNRLSCFHYYFHKFKRIQFTCTNYIISTCNITTFSFFTWAWINRLKRETCNIFTLYCCFLKCMSYNLIIKMKKQTETLESPPTVKRSFEDTDNEILQGPCEWINFDWISIINSDSRKDWRVNEKSRQFQKAIKTNKIRKLNENLKCRWYN